jgi:hypothetical protein
MGAYLRYFAIGIIIVLVLLALVLSTLDRRPTLRSGASALDQSRQRRAGSPSCSSMRRSLNFRGFLRF